MSLLILVGGFLAITLFGSILVKVINEDASFVEVVGLGFIIGLGLFTFVLFLFNLKGVSLTLGNANTILAILCLLSLILFFFRFQKFPLPAKFYRPKFSMIQKVLLGLLFILVACSFVTDLYWPVKDWDALVLYDFRAKVFTESGSIQKAIDVMSASNFVGYPLLTSLAHTYVYLTGAGNPTFIYALYYFSFLAISFSVLRNFLPRTPSLLFCLLLAVSPQLFDHSTMAYTNLPYTVYLVLGTFYLYLWIRRQKIGYLILAAILTGLSTWTRTAEPFWAANFGILGLYSGWLLLTNFSSIQILKLFQALAIYIVIFYALQLPWHNFMASLSYSVENNPLTLVGTAIKVSGILNLTLIYKLADYIFRFTILPAWWLFLLFPLGLLYQVLGRKNSWYGIIVLTFLAVFLVGIYVFANGYPGWEAIHGSLERMSMFFSPLLIFFMATVFSTKPN